LPGERLDLLSSHIVFDTVRIGDTVVTTATVGESMAAVDPGLRLHLDDS